jgi:hypothetical protein
VEPRAPHIGSVPFGLLEFRRITRNKAANSKTAPWQPVAIIYDRKEAKRSKKENRYLAQRNETKKTADARCKMQQQTPKPKAI